MSSPGSLPSFATCGTFPTLPGGIGVLGAGAEPAGVAFAAAEAVGTRGPIFKNSKGLVESSSRLPLPLRYCEADTLIRCKVITKSSVILE